MIQSDCNVTFNCSLKSKACSFLWRNFFDSQLRCVASACTLTRLVNSRIVSSSCICLNSTNLIVRLFHHEMKGLTLFVNKDFSFSKLWILASSSSVLSRCSANSRSLSRVWFRKASFSAVRLSISARNASFMLSIPALLVIASLKVLTSSLRISRSLDQFSSRSTASAASFSMISFRSSDWAWTKNE